jgi:hypothetical protein
MKSERPIGEVRQINVKAEAHGERGLPKRPVVEFAITGSVGLMGGIGALTKDYGLMAGALVLLANGSPLLSIDGLIAKKANK